MADRAIIVIDIGKTHAKLSMWDQTASLISLRRRPNDRLDGVLDVAGIECWLAEGLSGFAARAKVKGLKISAIIPVAHGAAAALVADGKLVCPPRDYEAPIPAEVRAEYDRLRGRFSETGSPALPDGLNLGAQLYVQKAQVAGQILLWPQYWSWLLSGVASSEVTSLGTHTDLWNPAASRFSELSERMGWAACFPPMRHAGNVLGPITPDWFARTGLPADTQIHCGVHDSNAALVAARGFPEIAGNEAAVLSTGTWFVALRSLGRTPVGANGLTTLPETRDCLINVDVEGQPVPSARFMGGREIELLGERIDQQGVGGVSEVIANQAIILPTFTPGCGPFPSGTGKWINQPADPDQRRAAVALYIALLADASLNLIGAKETLLIEGRFAQAEIFVRALASLRPDTAVYTSTGEGDVSFGALRLVDPSLKPQQSLERVIPLSVDLTPYRAEWLKHTEEGNTA